MATKTIVLAHGIFRFDKLSATFREEFDTDVGLRYFDGIGDYLRRHDFDVHEPDVSFAGSLSTRASNLKDRLTAIVGGGATSIHIIGHSMGGLDARKVLAENPELAAHVTCLTTIGTPHHGTTSADRALRVGGRVLISALSRLIDLEGFADLTTAACLRFNQSCRDAEVHNSVRYRAVAAVEDLQRTIAILQPTWVQLQHDEGDSDGIVSRTSQQWDATLLASNGNAKQVEQLSFPIPADHLNEVGLWDPAELIGGVTAATFRERVCDFYLQLARTA